METKLFKKEHKFAKGERRLRIKFFWKLAVLFMLTVAISSAFLGYYLFKQVNSEVILKDGDIVSQTETVKKERIEKALEYFDRRLEESNRILNSSAPVIDPSL